MVCSCIGDLFEMKNWLGKADKNLDKNKIHNNNKKSLCSIFVLHKQLKSFKNSQLVWFRQEVKVKKTNNKIEDITVSSSFNIETEGYKHRFHMHFLALPTERLRDNDVPTR